MPRAKSDQPSEVAKLFAEAFAQSTREANARALAAGVDGEALLAAGGAPKPPPRPIKSAAPALTLRTADRAALPSFLLEVTGDGEPLLGSLLILSWEERAFTSEVYCEPARRAECSA